MPTILVVDDEPSLHAILAQALGAVDREVVFADSVRGALEKAATLRALDLAMIDKNLPDGSGLDVVRELQKRFESAEFIVMTGYSSVPSAVDALKLGVFDYLSKPLPDLDRLAIIVENALDKARLRREQSLLLSEIKESEQRYELVLRATNDGIWDWNLLSDRVYFSPRWKAMLGYSDVDLGNRIDEWLSRIDEGDRERVRAAIDAHVQGHSSHMVIEHRVRHKDGSYRWVLTRGMVIRDSFGKAIRIAGSQTDITDRREAEEALLYDALHDRLTGLPNRILFVDRVNRSLALTKRDVRYGFALLIFDIDNCKLVNDGLGYGAGDSLLRAIVERVRGVLRTTDTLARLGADQLGAILEEVRTRQQAIEVVDRVRAALAKPFEHKGSEVYLTAGMGVTLSALSYVQGDEILRDSEIALKRAKALGKNSHAIFDREMETESVGLLELDTSLRRAISRGELRAYYQPVVAVATRKIVGFEALVRWEHPTRGLVPPGEFLPWAEDSGLIVEIGRVVFRQAFSQIRDWQKSFPRDPPLVMSVNVSATHLRRPDFVEDTRSLLAELGMDPTLVKLELTESVILNNSEQSNATLRQLRELGINLSMDDFGTGYSSLSYLQRFPFDTIKIDRSFIARLGDDPKSELLTRAVLGLAAGLGLSVVAEGVETEEQLQKLAEMQCEYAQGFLFSRAVPALVAEKLLGK
jgi:diguanylate cyclase (GGDEF)-like protein/PAS domain S-box-containing protein